MNFKKVEAITLINCPKCIKGFICGHSKTEIIKKVNECPTCLNKENLTFKTFIKPAFETWGLEKGHFIIKPNGFNGVGYTLRARCSECAINIKRFTKLRGAEFVKCRFCKKPAFIYMEEEHLN